MEAESVFVPEGNAYQPTEWSVGPWSPDTVQGGAYGGLLVRALEAMQAPAGMVLSRLSFDLWRPVTRRPLTPAVAVLREGRKAATVEASLEQDGKAVARCTALLLRADAASSPPVVTPAPAPPPPDAGAAIPEHVRRWSPFFTGVETRVIEGDLLKPGPAAAWFNLRRPLVARESISPLVQAVSAADLASGISAIVDLRVWSFINADLTMTLWRLPRSQWILLRAETEAGDRGTGSARGTLSDFEGPFGSCAQALIFDRRPPGR